MQKLPDNFETYDEARQRGFLALKELKDQGRRVVGVFCSYVPTELIYAADAIPVGLCASSEEPIPAGETRLPRNLCPLIKASYGFALTEKCPYFYFSDFVIGETTCDGKKKMFELMNELKETFVMSLPNSREPREATELLLERGWNGGDYEMNVMINNSLQFGVDQDFTGNSLRDVTERYVRLGLITNMDDVDEIMSLAWTPVL